MTIERVVEGLRSWPKGAELLVVGDLKTNLAAPEGDRRGEDIAATIATEGLEDMAQHLLPRERRWCWDRRTWGMLRKGREVRSRTDYILGTDRRLFRNVTVRDPRHNSDHYMVLGCLPSASLTEHKRYLEGRKRWPVRPPSKPTRVYLLFAALRRAVPKAQPREARQNAWISEETWRLIDKRVSARRDPRYEQEFKRQLGRVVKASLAANRKWRADKAGAEVGALVKADPPLIQEVWYHIQGWYQAAVNHTPPPARVTIERITAERVVLYSRVPPPGENVPVQIEPFEVEDKVPEEVEIEWAVKCLRNNRSRGASRMRAEPLIGWLAAARRRETGETADTEGGGQENTREGAENWARFVELVQTAFRDRDLAEEATWQAVVLILKGKKDYRDIAIVEVMWKVVAAILNRRFAASITYQDVLHGFRAGHGTGNTTLEDKLLQQLAALR